MSRLAERVFDIVLQNSPTLILILAAAIGWYVNYDREFTRLKDGFVHISEIQKEQNMRLNDIDHGGTRFSQQNLSKELDTINRDDDRITKLEEGDLHLMPKIQLIEDKLDSINEWIAEQKDRKK